jgi:hypothetical protein
VFPLELRLYQSPNAHSGQVDIQQLQACGDWCVRQLKKRVQLLIVVHLLAAILFFDYILTFDDEVQYFWGRKITYTSALFYVNRYFALGAYAAVLYSMFHTLSDEVKSSLSALPMH